MIIVLTLHNLTLQSSGLGRHGFFHFSNNIANFVDRNWSKFFPNEPRRKRKNLLGTIAGTLSQNSPETFMSGTDVVGSIGWWKLSKKWTPREFERFFKNRVKRSLKDDSDVDEVETKKMKTIANENLNLEDCCLDNEDDLLKELDQLKEELLTPSDIIEADSHVSNDLPSTSKKDVECQDDDDDNEELYQKLKSIIESKDVNDADIPPFVHRYYQQLHAMKASESSLNLKPKTESNQKPTHLDRYCDILNHHQHSLLVGAVSYDLFESPYSARVLHPFIYRDRKMFPRWLRLMCEVKHAANNEAPERSTIDFCYAKPQHIPAVNSLLQRIFWPGIDMSESLSYPDFTVVALYNKLLIGCAFLVPDVCHNEAYISFLAVRPGWDRCGIGSFMLYHLTQTSHDKDMTLHVSASNPAICLYQKFGFKTEELTLDFYEKYLPHDSPHSPHALFLRLTR